MNKRIIYIFGLFSLLMLLVLVRTAYLQLWQGPNSGSSLAAMALKYRSQAVPAEEYYRGEILDRNLVSLTDSDVRLTLVAFPASVRNIKETARQLQERLGLDADYTEGVITRGQETFGGRSPVILKGNLSAAEQEDLAAAKISGIAVLPIKTRYGPQALATHLIGYLSRIDQEVWRKLQGTGKTAPTLPTGYQITDKIGVAGLEEKYEEVLRGSAPESRIVGIADAGGRLLEGLGYKIQAGQVDSWRNHLVLTLDRRYQEIVEKTMDRYVVRGAVAVLDIENCDVLAVASRPNFDQNEVSKHLNGKDELIDRTSRVAFYPGSVFKMVTAAGVLEEGLIQPGELFECSGSHGFSDGTRISCLQDHGLVGMSDAIIKSCNTTFVQLGLRLGSAKLVQYAAKLGFTINVDDYSPPALIGNASIGQQGVLASPLQVANLYATIARNGYYRPWRIVKEIRNYQGDVIHEYPLQPSLQAISPATAASLREALIAAAQDGPGYRAWLDEFGTAGKTGTAQANNENKVIAWFAGFTPLDNPRLAIAVMVEEDAEGAATGLRGGETAAPIFKEIAAGILQLDKF